MSAANSNRSLAVGQPKLPGLMPDAEAKELARSFTTWIEGTTVIISRHPTPAERQILSSRRDVLNEKLAPLGKTTEKFEIIEANGERKTLNGMQFVRRSLGLFFLGYPSLVNADAAGLVTAYAADLSQLPVFAVLQALDDIKHGRVTIRDSKRGFEIPLDKDWPPSSPRIFDVALKATDALNSELLAIGMILGPTRLATPSTSLSPEQRERSAVKIQTMNDEFKRAMAEPSKWDPPDRKIADKNRTEQDAKDRELHERALEQEYARIGVKPVFIGDTMISVSLARKVAPDRFIKKTGAAK